ncbi:transposase family protein [Propionibacterium australiense]|uniref:transposase family protein n=1 Tax=Propionibacterium australiense TaxID=119981 RepID=UPI001603AC1B|nr:transposase family protein [Propionibacterium australiense]
MDGTLVPCWDCKHTQGPYSGKHHTPGLNLHIASTLTGKLIWVGSTHDTKALQLIGFLDIFPDTPPLGDKGYIGLGMTTPIREQPRGGLTGWQKEYSKTINSLRAPVERAIAQVKTWRTLHTGYRRPLHTFPQTITAATALEFCKTVLNNPPGAVTRAATSNFPIYSDGAPLRP